MPTDPVCGMFVADSSDLVSTIDGQNFYFCSKSCLLKYSSPMEEQVKLKRRLLLSWSLSIPIISITYLITPAFLFRDYILLALSFPVQIYGGFGFYQGAYHSLKSRSANMDLLVSLGTVTAFVFSVFVTLFPAEIPNSQVYFDASAFIITLILTGSYIENFTKTRANRAAAKLIEIVPKTSHLISASGEITEIATDQIKVGDQVLFKPGDTISTDGVVVDGKSEVDESMLTGEQAPVVKSKNSEVSSGTANINGVLRVSVTRTGKDSTVSQIYELIQRAISGRAKVQRIADIFSAAFVPVVIAVAAASSLFWYFYLNSIGSTISIEISVLAFVSVVVIACPCAIGLAAPITLLIASNLSSENGILVKNTTALDRLSRANRAVFDKSGTLTETIPEVSEIKSLGNESTDYLLSIAASIEESSNHPAALAIVKFAREKDITIKSATSVREIPGEGIEGKIEDHNVSLKRSGSAGASSIVISIDGVDAGIISLEYKLRDNAQKAIAKLRSLGVETAILTGDTREEADRIALMLGISDIHAGIRPEQKAEIITRYQEAGDYVIYTGDGINDSIALETADVGIALASGTDIARESGEIILLKNDLLHVAYAKVIGSRTISKIKQNIGWAFGYNAVLIPIAAGVLVPVFGLSIFSILPILAAFAMGMSSSSVVINSLMLRRRIKHSLSSIG